MFSSSYSHRGSPNIRPQHLKLVLEKEAARVAQGFPPPEMETFENARQVC